jgi:hypothetical protein
MAKYGNFRIYRITRVDFDRTPESTFMSRRGPGSQSFLQYYQSVYNIQIRNR